MKIYIIDIPDDGSLCKVWLLVRALLYSRAFMAYDALGASVCGSLCLPADVKPSLKYKLGQYRYFARNRRVIARHSLPVWLTIAYNVTLFGFQSVPADH